MEFRCFVSKSTNESPGKKNPFPLAIQNSAHRKQIKMKNLHLGNEKIWFQFISSQVLIFHENLFTAFYIILLPHILWFYNKFARNWVDNKTKIINNSFRMTCLQQKKLFLFSFPLCSLFFLTQWSDNFLNRWFEGQHCLRERSDLCLCRTLW